MASAITVQPQNKKMVTYYYDNDIGNYFYGEGHLMKPHRIRMTHNLILNYGIYRFMKILSPPKTASLEMTKFHADCYIKLLRVISPENMVKHAKRMQRFNVGGDCPVFGGLYEFCQLSSGGSIAAAAQLNRKNSDICINWSGGLHHAKKARASGFCYVNDVVLAILELLKCHQRVLYVDVDVHHGDGVEEAFYTSDRVMTVSFHKFGEEYFPGTGAINDIGACKGKYYAINVPLNDGMDDESYENIFVPIMTRIMDTYQPNVVVLQCGADSLTGDRLGCFNLTIRGHGKCIEFIKKYNLPLLMLGGGGYTLRNVAKLWTYETSLALGVEIVNDIPYNDYLEYYGPDYKLHSSPSNMANENTKKYLQDIKERVFENIRMLPHAPGIQFQNIVELYGDSDDEDNEMNKDKRITQKDRDNRIVADNEFSDSEDEGQDGRRDAYSYKGEFEASLFGSASDKINYEINKIDLKSAETEDSDNTPVEDKIKFGINKILKESQGGTKIRKIVFTLPGPKQEGEEENNDDSNSSEVNFIKNEIKTEKEKLEDDKSSIDLLHGGEE